MNHSIADQSRIVQPVSSERIQALEALWSALKDRNNITIGYNPAVHAACDRLRELDRADIQQSSLKAQGFVHPEPAPGDPSDWNRIESWSNLGGRDPGDENDSKIGSPS